MIVRFDEGRLTLAGESEAERAGLATWAQACRAHPVVVDASSQGIVLKRAAPINVAFDDTPMPLRLISNLAATPFDLDGRRFGSVEAFWQGLKFDDEAKRAEIAPLDGFAAKTAGTGAPPHEVVRYRGAAIRVGTVDHWALMERANRAKFEQHAAARAALFATMPNSLEHRVAVDSRTIPGLIMADIWMRIRAELISSAV